MAWVRYDDQFPMNGKVTAVIAEDPGALSLQLLANTWSNTTKFPGYIPPHQPAILLADRALAAKWLDVLVRAGLFHERGVECRECREEYATLPADKATGYVIHNAKEYRPPARDRVTPGTSSELSEKRRAAGRKGGKAAAARRLLDGQQVPANQASQANGVANPVANNDDDAKQNPDAPPDAETGTDTPGTPPAETPATPEVNGHFAGVSKTSKLLKQSVSPVPVPDSSLASSEARARTSPKSQGAVEQATFDGMPATPEEERIFTDADRAFGVARAWQDERAADKKPIVARTRKGVLHTLQSLILPCLANQYTEVEVLNALRAINTGIPSAQQLDKKLGELRDPEDTRSRSQRGKGGFINSGANKHNDSQDRRPQITGLRSSDVLAEQATRGDQ